MVPLDLAHVATDAEISDIEVISAFATLAAALRTRGLIRTRNVVGDLGENYAILAYERNPARMPINLHPINTTDVDAFDGQNRSYAIKSVSSFLRTSAFHFEPQFDEENPAFDFLVVVHVGPQLQPLQVLEFTWADFFRIKSWSNRQEAWFLSLTKARVAAATIVYPIN